MALEDEAKQASINTRAIPPTIRHQRRTACPPRRPTSHHPPNIQIPYDSFLDEPLPKSRCKCWCKENCKRTVSKGKRKSPLPRIFYDQIRDSKKRVDRDKRPTPRYPRVGKGRARPARIDQVAAGGGAKRNHGRAARHRLRERRQQPQRIPQARARDPAGKTRTRAAWRACLLRHAPVLVFATL